jgi:hypothetical protein
MIKAVILSPSFNYYTLYIRNKGLNPHEYPYYMGDALGKIRGLSRELPFFFLEGWSENENYTGSDIRYIKQLHPIKEISKGWIENEGIMF